MSFAGHSHFVLVAAMGIWIAIVFAIAARWTKASRSEVLAGLVGGAVAGAINAATDAAAHAAGFWRYPEVTTPFGPLLYYADAGLGCGALALVLRWLRRRRGLRAALVFVGVLFVYAPIRDWVTAATTHLIEFRYEPWLVVVIADALSSFVVPVLVAYGVIALTPVHREAPAGSSST